ncbi:hypothetical protein [Natrialba swarupiae]|uniref:Uncharacterized protein n=1 Tax=Natrialba swarupiae TaxID=2448032 RepID=A0A5D5AEP4_9EURY|nr:hypothetical protein [Natrialba swarupiae]TYT60268.1 hypothetical protein FYC77_19820 [Natrialba swarupiae]
MSSKHNYSKETDGESSIETRVPIRCTNEFCNGPTPDSIPESKLDYAHCPSCEGNLDEQTGSFSWKESYEHFQESQEGDSEDDKRTRFHEMDDEHCEVIHEDEDRITIRIRRFQIVERGFSGYEVSQITNFDQIDGCDVVLKRGDAA